MTLISNVVKGTVNLIIKLGGVVVSIFGVAILYSYLLPGPEDHTYIVPPNATIEEKFVACKIRNSSNGNDAIIKLFELIQFDAPQTLVAIARGQSLVPDWPEDCSEGLSQDQVTAVQSSKAYQKADEMITRGNQEMFNILSGSSL